MKPSKKASSYGRIVEIGKRISAAWMEQRDPREAPSRTFAELQQNRFDPTPISQKDKLPPECLKPKVLRSGSRFFCPQTSQATY